MEEDKPAVAFGIKLKQMFSSAFSNLNIITGLEVGLFETLSNFKEPKSYNEIAEKARLKPRYVKELLGCLTAAGIVDVDPETEKYFLPEHRRSYFDKTELNSCVVQYMELLPKLCLLREKVVKCYPLNGPKGVDHECYKEYSSHMSKITAIYIKEQLVSYIDQVEGLTDMLDSGVESLDVACGTGHTSVVMAERFPNSKFTGLDLMAEQLEVGRDIGKSRKLSNVTFHQLDVEKLPREWTERFEFVLCHYCIHDLGDPKQGLKEIWRVLKPSGVGLIIDVNLHSKHSDNVNNQFASMAYGFSEVHCMPSSLSQGGGWGLGAGWGIEYAKQLITECGFNVEIIENVETVSYSIKKQVNNVK